MNKRAFKFIQVHINIHLKSVWHLAKATVKTLLVRSSCLTPKPNFMLHSPHQLPEGPMSGGCEMHCWWYEKHKSRWMTRQYFCESGSNWLSVPASGSPPTTSWVQCFTEHLQCHEEGKEEEEEDMFVTQQLQKKKTLMKEDRGVSRWTAWGGTAPPHLFKCSSKVICTVMSLSLQSVH